MHTDGLQRYPDLLIFERHQNVIEID